MHKSQSAKRISKLPQRKSATQRNEYGKAKKGIVVCPHCHNYLYKKEWHHPMRSSGERIQGGDIRFKLCPACWMAREGLYEGEIIITPVPSRFEVELVRLITSQSAAAQKRDPQDRVLTLKKQRGGYRVTTTENVLAQKLAKKIKSVFKRVEYKISYPGEPSELVRIEVAFTGTRR